MEKRTMIRICIAILWIVIGVIGLVRKETTMGIVSVAVGILFAFSVFKTLNKK